MVGQKIINYFNDIIMNIKLKYLLYSFSFMFVLMSCNDWTDVEPKEEFDMDNSNKTEEYYQALRDYKQSDHAVTFGWFGNWNGVGSSLTSSMAGLPDSVDFVSMWGSWRNPSEMQLKDLRYVQKSKGTKALMVFIISNMGEQLTPPEYVEKGEAGIKEFWGWVDDDDVAIESAIRKYANAICDTIKKYDYDGFDLDYEPNYGHSGNMSAHPDRMLIWCDEMSKHIGPKSGTDKLFVVDGEPQSMPSASGPMFDYFIVQAYWCSSYADLDGRLDTTIENFKEHMSPEEVAQKYLVTENFESLASTGGVSYRTRDGRYVQSLEGMALWNPIINGKSIRKAGIGSYHMEYEYKISGKKGTYPFLRKAIQIMNPTVQ